MITLIGHGYVGQHIAQELQKQNLPHTWIHHYDPVPICTNWIINAAGYTGSPNVDACETYRDGCMQGNVTWPSHVSFDHDLGVNAPTGMDFAKFLVELDMITQDLPRSFTYSVHSDNPPGAANIHGLMQGYLKHRAQNFS